jgi:hypothetical protein
MMPRSAERPSDITQLPHPSGARGDRKIVTSDAPGSQADDSNNVQRAPLHFIGLSVVILGLALTLLWSGYLAWCAYTLLAQFLAA